MLWKSQRVDDECKLNLKVCLMEATFSSASFEHIFSTFELVMSK